MEFRESNINFCAVLAELKREGKGAIEHHAVITDADVQKLYNSVLLPPNTTSGLFNKVQFDVRLYFFQRGSENMHKMTMSTFCVKTDSNTGLKYVYKHMEELTKNHRETVKENSSGGYMPQFPNDNVMCPVSSFEKYVSKLNQRYDRLWQRHRDSFCEQDDIWYCNTPVGVKTLQIFMSTLRKDCNMSGQYTNCNIRATRATLLSRNQFGAAQIISVTGQKSVSSFAVYQRESDLEKLAIGHTIGKHVNMPKAAQNTHALPAPLQHPALQAPLSHPALPAPSTHPAVPESLAYPAIQAPSTISVPVLSVSDEAQASLTIPTSLACLSATRGAPIVNVPEGKFHIVCENAASFPPPSGKSPGCAISCCAERRWEIMPTFFSPDNLFNSK